MQLDPKYLIDRRMENISNLTPIDGKQTPSVRRLHRYKHLIELQLSDPEKEMLLTNLHKIDIDLTRLRLVSTIPPEIISTEMVLEVRLSFIEQPIFVTLEVTEDEHPNNSQGH